MSSKKSYNQVMPASSASWIFPGFSTFRFLVNRMEIIKSAIIMIHVTTTVSLIGIPPNSGMVNAVSQLSSSINALARSFVISPSFDVYFYCKDFVLFVMKDIFFFLNSILLRGYRMSINLVGFSNNKNVIVCLSDV